MEMVGFLADFAPKRARPGLALGAKRRAAGAAGQVSRPKQGNAMDWHAIFDNFRRAVTQHYFDMRGRVGRSEFWYFVAVDFAIGVLAVILSAATFLPLAPIYSLAMILPQAGMGARRLQDTGKDGRMVWLFVILIAVRTVVALLTAMTFAVAGLFGLIFVPALSLVALAGLAVGLVLLWFWCQPGDAGANAYGPVPPRFDPSVRASPTP
jgi:uncharacterized membrane protein YhaH (DUF805 family)